MKEIKVNWKKWNRQRTIEKILCFFKGHKWQHVQMYKNQDSYECARCGEFI